MKVKCLQSGVCCTSFEVHGVPGYKDGIKPEFEPCRHLIQAYKDGNGKWHRAKCQLYHTPDFPEECRMFNFPGPNLTCAIGEAMWKKRGVEDPENEILD